MSIVDGPRLLKERHLKMSVKQNGRVLRAIQWNAAEHNERLTSMKEGVEIAYTIEENEYQGNQVRGAEARRLPLTRMPRSALIVGAGIGGLSAAIALRRTGWHVRVFEQAESPREVGFGIALAPNAITALRELGVADVVLNRGFEPRRGEFRRPNGTVLRRAELPPDAVAGPLLIALRPALHGALLDAVGVNTISRSARVTGCRQSGSRVSIQLSDGETADGDLLIGADGIGSTVRRTLHPTEAPPRHSGIIAVRGGVHGALHHLGNLHAVYYVGPGIESMFVRASDTGMYWFLSLAIQLIPATVREPRAIVDMMAPGFDATFRAITSGHRRHAGR